MISTIFMVLKASDIYKKLQVLELRHNRSFISKC